ncbi:hypothetical protein [Micromonospora musae]|nr:hypothetical protein [Micromonospora musae]
MDDERARRAATPLKKRGPVDLTALAAILDEPDDVTPGDRYGCVGRSSG